MGAYQSLDFSGYDTFGAGIGKGLGTLADLVGITPRARARSEIEKRWKGKQDQEAQPLGTLAGLTQPEAPPEGFMTLSELGDPKPTVPQISQAEFDQRWNAAAPMQPGPLAGFEDALRAKGQKMAANARPMPPMQQEAVSQTAQKRSGTQKGRAFYEGFMKRGLSSPQAAVLAGHMQQESGFNPNAWNAKEGAGGLIQWRLNRLENLKKFAAQTGRNWNDPEAQADFVLHEMQTTEAGPGQQFLAAKDLPTAHAALKRFIRYGDKSDGIRLANAQQFASLDGSGQGVGSPVPQSQLAAMGGQGTSAPSAQVGPSTEDLQFILTNPYATDGDRKLAAMYLEQRMPAKNSPMIIPAGAMAIDPSTGEQIALNPKSFGSVAGASGMGRIPAGYRISEDGSRLEAIPGGPEDPTMPRAPSELTATDKKAILEADDLVAANEAVINSLGQALQLNPQANSGYTAGARTWMGNNLPDMLVPDALSSPQSAQASSELNNVVTEQALNSLKTVFGGNPTEGERRILLDMQGSINQPPNVRQAIYQRALQAAQKRLEFNRQRVAALRGGTFYSPGSQAGQPQQPASTSSAAPYPEGTRLRGPDGRMYRVANGQPVPE